MSTFNSEEKNLILIQALDFFAYSLANIFVTVYFYSHSDIKTTIIYNIFLYSTLLVFYVASGWTLRKVSSAFLIRLGLIATAIFYFLLFGFKETSIKFIIPLGILSGFGAGNYWAGYNLNQYIYTNKEKRVEYFGSTAFIINAVQALAPLLGGAIIALTKSRQIFGLEAGYSLLFFIVFLITLLMIWLAGKLPEHEIPNFSYKHIVSHERSKPWKLILWQQAIMGFYDVTVTVVTGILLFLIIKEEFILGTSQTIASVLGAVASIISIKLLRKNSNSYWIGALGLTSGIALFAFLQNWFGVVFFILVTGFCAPFLYNWFSIIYFRTLDSFDTSWKEKYHLMLERDISLGSARIISCIVLFIFLQFGDQVSLARTWLFFLPFLPLILGFLLWKMKSAPGMPPVVSGVNSNAE